MVWLFMPEELVPERWRARSVHGCMVPLLPEEAAGILRDGSTAPRSETDDERLIGLVARGLTRDAMSARLGISPRSVQRKLGELRRRFDVDSNLELTAFLAERGFASGASIGDEG